MESNLNFKNLSLIYPCYNEQDSIPFVIPKAIELKNQIKNLEIIVVNDGSTDLSKKLLTEHESKIKIINLSKTQGYGAAIKIGVEQAQGDWLAFCDLDFTCMPEDLKKLLLTAEQKSSAIVFGNRIHKKSCMPKIRMFGNRVYSFVIYCVSFAKVIDPCSGFRLFQKDRFQNIISELPNDLSFSIALTACCIRQKISYHFVDITYNERRGVSKLNSLKDGFIFLFVLLKYLFKKSS